MALEPVENCENCGSKIGKLEKACIWQDHIVCNACHRKLDRKGFSFFKSAVIAIIVLCASLFGLVAGWQMREKNSAKITPVESQVGTATEAQKTPEHSEKQTSHDVPATKKQEPVGLIVRVVYVERPTTLGSVTILDTRLRLLNRNEKHVTIQRVLVNGECDVPIKEYPINSFSSVPVELTIGGDAVFLVSTQTLPNTPDFPTPKPTGYAKEIIFVDVTTNEGTFRYPIK